MKFFFSLLFSIIFCLSANSQFGPQQIISSTTDKAYLSLPIDIDNDGFIDVLTAEGEGIYSLQWHRNLDGFGNFGSEILIPNNPALYLSIEFVDLDTDGDKDLLYLVNNPRIVAWLENLDGLGNFGAEQIIINERLDFVSSIKTEDIDNDNDLDLIVDYGSTTLGDRIAWHENLNGLANFGAEEALLDVAFNNYSLPLFVDIDNDGNRDMLTSYEFLHGPAKLVWYRNLGNVTFDNEQVIYQFTNLKSDLTSIYEIQYVDINTDGKKDIVIISHNDDIGTFYHWFENLNNSGDFGPIQSLPISGSFCDIDNDGDNDILAGNRFVNRIYWVENTDGLGAFTAEHTITTEVDFIKDIKNADINGDDKTDVISASLSDDKIAWYENLGSIGVNQNKLIDFTIYPNPTDDIIEIQSEKSITKIEIYNKLGQLVFTVLNKKEIDISSLQKGVYLVKVTNEYGTTGVEKVIKI